MACCGRAKKPKSKSDLGLEANGVAGSFSTVPAGQRRRPKRGSDSATSGTTSASDSSSCEEPFSFNWGNPEHYGSRTKKLGEGAYGVVYKAMRLKPKSQVVVIKVFKKDNFNADRVKQEADVLAKICRGPNILRLVDMVYDRTMGEVNMVTEFFEAGAPELVEKNIDLYGLHLYMKALVGALKYAHSLNILHRDVKAANVLYNMQTCELRLIDWGFGKEIADPMTDWPGTRWFKCAELFLHAPEYDGAVDMWAVGVLLGTMLQRKTPLFVCRGSTNFDQFIGIFELLGTEDYEPYYDSVENIPDEYMGMYDPAKFARLPQRLPESRVDWTEHMADSDLVHATAALDLMDALLQIDPKRRLTAAQALKHPFLRKAPPRTAGVVTKASRKAAAKQAAEAAAKAKAAKDAKAAKAAKGKAAKAGKGGKGGKGGKRGKGTAAAAAGKGGKKAGKGKGGSAGSGTASSGTVTDDQPALSHSTEAITSSHPPATSAHATTSHVVTGTSNHL